MANAVLLVPVECSGDLAFEEVVKCVDSVCVNTKCIVIPFTKRCYVHYILPILEALQAFEEGRNIARKFELEVLARFYCTRQLSIVMERARREFEQVKRAVIAIIGEANRDYILNELSRCRLSQIDGDTRRLFNEPCLDLDIARIALTSILLRD